MTVTVDPIQTNEEEPTVAQQLADAIEQLADAVPVGTTVTFTIQREHPPVPPVVVPPTIVTAPCHCHHEPARVEVRNRYFMVWLTSRFSWARALWTGIPTFLVVFLILALIRTSPTSVPWLGDNYTLNSLAGNWWWIVLTATILGICLGAIAGVTGTRPVGADEINADRAARLDANFNTREV